jgi:hypothetical protein
MQQIPFGGAMGGGGGHQAPGAQAMGQGGQQPILNVSPYIFNLDNFKVRAVAIFSFLFPFKDSEGLAPMGRYNFCQLEGHLQIVAIIPNRPTRRRSRIRISGSIAYASFCLIASTFGQLLYPRKFRDPNLKYL